MAAHFLDLDLSFLDEDMVHDDLALAEVQPSSGQVAKEAPALAIVEASPLSMPL